MLIVLYKCSHNTAGIGLGEFNLAVCWFNKNTAKLNSTIVNSSFGRCGLLHWSVATAE